MGICPTKPSKDKTLVLEEPEIVVNAVQIPRKPYKSKNLSTSSKQKNFHRISLEYLLGKREEVDAHLDFEKTLAQLWSYKAQVIDIHKWRDIREIEVGDKRGIYQNRTAANEWVAGQIFSIISRHMKKIKTLTLNLFDLTNVTNRTLSAFADICQRFVSIENLSLFCYDPSGEITDEGLKFIRMGISKHITTLKHLTISFKSCRNITDYGIKLLVSKIGGLSMNLNHLALNFEDCSKLTDESLGILGYCFGRYLVRLQHLDLSFENCHELTDSGLQVFAAKLCNHLTGLKKISFNFGNCSLMLTDKGLDILISNLGAHFKNLTHLSLNLSNLHGLSDKGIQILGEHLRVKFRALRELKLNFLGCRNPTDNGFRLLSIQIGQLSQLKQLSLQISNAELNTDNFLQNLFSSQSSPSLQTLYLSLSGCINVTDKGIWNLGLALSSKCSSLKNLTLNFSRCGNLTDMGIASMLRKIGTSLIHLEKLELDFSWCKDLTFECLKEFQNDISSHLKHLRKLSLLLFRCEKISQEEMYNLKQKLDFIPSLCLL